MPSIPMKLTQAQVDNASIPTKDEGRVLVNDTSLPGLVLVLYPSGKRSWFVRYRPGGRGVKDRWHSLGDGAVPLKDARDHARRVLADVAKAKAGEGPTPHEKRASARRARQQVEALPNVGDAYASWLQTLSKAQPHVRKEYQGLFQRHGGPIAGLRVDAVTAAHLTDLHRSLEGRKSTANHLRARLRTFFTWCEKQGYRPRHSNPTDDVTPYPKVQKDRPFTRDELTALYSAITRAEAEGVPVCPERQGRTRGVLTNRPSRAAEMRARREANGQDPARARTYTMTQPRAKRGPRPQAAEANPPRLARISPAAADALRFLLLTGWRKREVLSLQWAFVNLDSGVADLPHTKGGRSVRPLSDAAIALLKARPAQVGSPYVFTSSRVRKDGTPAPLKDISSAWLNVRYAAGLHGRMHDLRHTFASQAVSHGVDLHAVGAMLGHRDFRSTMIYAKYDMRSLRSDANKAGEIIESAKPGLRIA